MRMRCACCGVCPYALRAREANLFSFAPSHESIKAQRFTRANVSSARCTGHRMRFQGEATSRYSSVNPELFNSHSRIYVIWSSMNSHLLYLHNAPGASEMSVLNTRASVKDLVTALANCHLLHTCVQVVVHLVLLIPVQRRDRKEIVTTQ